MQWTSVCSAYKERLPDCLDLGTLLLITGLIGKEEPMVIPACPSGIWAEVNTASWQASTFTFSATTDGSINTPG
jgi:hypothetical protein